MNKSSRLDNWKKVWERKGTETQGVSLIDLITANGFDSGAGKMTEAVWMKMIEQIKDELKLLETDSLLEVGCGAGAILLPLSFLPLNLAGIDYSSTLIDICNKAVKDVDARVSEAVNIPFPDSSFSRVLSHGVFHYFPDKKYAEAVLEEMLRVLKKGGGLLIIGVPDQAKKEDSEKFRRILAENEGEEYLTNEDSDYAHLYYSKDFFTNFFNSRGLTVRIFDRNLDGYSNARFQYNVLVWT